MSDYFDLMSDSLARRWAAEKEAIEERSRLSPPEIENMIFHRLFGRAFRACVYFKKQNLTMISRRLGFPGQALRDALDSPQADKTAIKVALADPDIDFFGWLSDMRDNHDFFKAMARDVMDGGID